MCHVPDRLIMDQSQDERLIQVNLDSKTTRILTLKFYLARVEEVIRASKLASGA